MNADFDKQIKELAHNIRNKYTGCKTRNNNNYLENNLFRIANQMREINTMNLKKGNSFFSVARSGGLYPFLYLCKQTVDKRLWKKYKPLNNNPR